MLSQFRCPLYQALKSIFLEMMASVTWCLHPGKYQVENHYFTSTIKGFNNIFHKQIQIVELPPFSPGSRGLLLRTYWSGLFQKKLTPQLTERTWTFWPPSSALISKTLGQDLPPIQISIKCLDTMIIFSLTIKLSWGLLVVFS